MAIRERMIYAIDIVTDKAANGLSSLKTKLNDAGTASGKFKVLASEAMNQVQAHAAELALAGGAALVTFGVKSVQAFTDGALAAGKFATASGLSTEEASRWVAVADDVGVSGEAMAGAFLKMERAVASGKGAWTDYGIEVARGADGQVDATATMLNAIEAVGRIQDPLKRAEVAQSLWGRGFAEVSEVVLGNAGKIEKALGEVSDAQIFDEDEVKKAREFRAAMDELSDALQEIALTAGEFLTPAVTDAAESLADLADGIDKVKSLGGTLPGWVKTAGKAFVEFQLPLANVRDRLGDVGGAAKDVGGWLSIGGDGADEAADKFGLLEGVVADLTNTENMFAQTLEDVLTAAGDSAGATENLASKSEGANQAAIDLVASLDVSAAALRNQADAAGEAFEGIRDLRDEYAKLRGDLEDRSAFLDVQDEFDNVADAAADAWTAASEGADDAERKVRDYEQAQIQLKQKVIDFAEEVGNIPPETVAEINALIDDGALAEAQRLLDSLTVTRTAYVDTVVRNVGTPGNRRAPRIGPTVDGALAHGGPTRAGGLYEVTEGGKSELLHENGRTYLMAGDDGQVTPIASAGTSGRSGTAQPIYVTVNAGIKADGPEIARLVADAVAKYRRFNGPGSV